MQELSLTQFSFLNFTGNEITDDDVPWLSQLLSQGPSIEELYLSKNKLTAKGFEKLRLKIVAHPKLRSLHLDNMPLDEAAIQQIAGIVPVLKHLDLENCNVNGQGGKLLAAAFEENQTLESLKLNGNRSMAGAALLAIIQSLQQHTKLKTLELKQIPLDSDCQQALLLLSMSCPNLIKIEWDPDVIDEIRTQDIQRNLKVHRDFNYGNSGQLEIIEEDFPEIHDQKHDVPEDEFDSLNELVLAGKQLTNRQMRLFSAVIQRNAKLEKLNITNNPSITVMGLNWLLPSISRHLGLSCINLSDNSLKDEGAIELAKVLPHCQWKVLKLHANKIQAKGGLALANGLAQNQSLNELDLSSNPLTDAVIVGHENDEKNENAVYTNLITAVISQARLISLSLQDTKLSEISGRKLLAMLSSSVEYLYVLNITDNKMPEKLVGHINMRLIDNKKRKLNHKFENCTKRQKELEDEILNLQKQNDFLNIELRLYELRLECTRHMHNVFEGYRDDLQEYHQNFELNRQDYPHIKITEQEINDRVSPFKGLNFFSEQAALESLNTAESEIKEKEDKQTEYLDRRNKLTEEYAVNDAEINSITQQKLTLEEQRRDLSDSYGEPDSARLNFR